MKMRCVDLRLILDYKGALCPGRKWIRAIRQGHGLAGAKYDGVDVSQVNDFRKGRTEKGIGAQAGGITVDVGIGDISSKLDRH